MPVFVLAKDAAAMMWRTYKVAYARNAVLICKKLGDDTLRVPVFDNMMLTDEHESHAGGIGDYEWWTLYYPFLSFYGEVVDHDCYEICRLSYCFWPSAPLGKGIARMHICTQCCVNMQEAGR